MSRMVWLSFPLDVQGPRPPAIPEPSLEPLYTIDRDQASVQTLRVASHTGTHVDAPAHVVRGGLTLEDFEPEDFVYICPVVVDLSLPPRSVLMPEHIEPLGAAIGQADLLLLRFGYGELRREEPDRYCTDCPGLGVEAATRIRRSAPQLRCLGLDVPSLACIASLDATMASHNELLKGQGRRFLVIEDMNLEEDLSRLSEVRLSPWLVHGMDSGPCSVVGVLD